MSDIPTRIQNAINQTQPFFRQLDYLVDTLSSLYQQLMVRLSPLIEHFRPIWQDPLWQMVGLIVAIIFAIVLVIFGVKYLKRVVMWTTRVLVGSCRWIYRTLLWPWRKIGQGWQQRKAKRASTGTIRRRRRHIHANRAANAIKFLITRREWRYHLPWTLLIGEDSDNRAALIQSVKTGRRANLLPQEKRMLGQRSGWHFYDHGVVIETCGDELSETLNQLHWFRPERALDNITLVISAKSLLNDPQPGALDALGERVFQQLWQVQKTSGFVLPVYVFISDCDQVAGFEAFWQAQPDTQRQQMVGWSNPYRLERAFNLVWIREAFVSTLEALQNAQLRVASSGGALSEIDDFMLFVNRFAKLEMPLTEVIKSAFTRSGLQESPPLRGVYFCGQYDQRTAFVEDAFHQKIFAERHLASMVEKRRFSTNQLLRRFQIGTLVAAVVMTGWLGIDIVRFYQWNQYVRGTYQQLSQLAPDDSATGANTYQLLIGLNHISQRNLSLMIPLSWFDWQEIDKERLVAQNLIQKTLLVGLDARLKLRAKQLSLLMSEEDLAQTSYPVLMQTMQVFQKQLLGFVQNQNYLALLASPKASTQGVSEKLTSLLNYLYDNPVPTGIDLNDQLIVGAVRRANYAEPWIVENRPLVSTSLIMRYLDDLTHHLHDALIKYAQQLPIAAVQRFNNTLQPVSEQNKMPPAQIIPASQAFQRWLNTTKKDWLTTSVNSSPCSVLEHQFDAIRQALLPHGFYNSQDLARMQARFSPERCDQAVRQALVSVTASPFGSLFQFDQRGLLSESSDLTAMLKSLNTITKIGFVREGFPPFIDSSEPIILWQPAPLQKLISALADYQNYLTQPGHTSLFVGALQNRLQQATQRLLSNAMIHPSQQVGPPAAVLDIVSYREKRLHNAVKSFTQVQGLLIQIDSLLKQQGDYASVQWLNQQIQKFIFQQLKIADQLVRDYHLYQPLNAPQWQQSTLSQALFDISSGKSLKAYLTNQRQRLSYLAYNQTQPLIIYLQNTQTGLSNERVQRWLATLQNLRDFERGEPNNMPLLLDKLIGKKFKQAAVSECSSLDLMRELSGEDGWFAIRHDQIIRQVAMHCSSSEQSLAIARYVDIAEQFNQDVAGKFPFADSPVAGGGDVGLKALHRYLERYRQDSQGLFALLTQERQKDHQIPQSWIHFIQQMDAISAFMQQAWDDKTKTWRVALKVTFNAPNQQGQGNNQVIQWTLSDDKHVAGFPNGDDQLTWQPGQPLSLSLRWAEGSAYRPQDMAGQAAAHKPRIDPQERTATFISQGKWGLFQWLRRYDSDEMHAAHGARLLSFYVPVGLKDESGNTKPLSSPTYISRSNILLQAQVADETGQWHTVAFPDSFPTYAPKFK
ncbi:type VI secretion system protein [Vibrio gazogenes]|uniref:Type VI secretion system component TssM1 N-terminal domain-containing protein n=1 Tax=Vibrio gazogenes TaxID=687 RepID=A0A1Z2SJF9_VIBGA|nr:type VI secretion system protein [Vibrio gazogenes]ASA57318.1 hypothetical protein BSQ33_16155 [Vibrio gazogenes]